MKRPNVERWVYGILVGVSIGLLMILLYGAFKRKTRAALESGALITYQSVSQSTLREKPKTLTDHCWERFKKLHADIGFVSRFEIVSVHVTPFTRTVIVRTSRRGQSYQEMLITTGTVFYDVQMINSSLEGRVQSFGYDADGRVSGIKDVVDAVTEQLFTYTYDANATRATTADVNGSLTTYTYDGKDRLTQEATSGTNAHTFNYTWDSRDNMLTHNEAGPITTMTFDAASRVASYVRGTTTVTHTYDANGNITEVEEPSEQWEFAWDKENRLVEQSEVQSERQFSFHYDPFSHKVFELEDGGAQTNLFWLDDMYIGEGFGEITKAFIQSGGVLIGEVEDVGGQDNTNYYMVDALGSITGETDDSNTVWNKRRMTPLGRKLSGANVPVPGPGFAGANNYRETGLGYAFCYMWHRHYDCETGRWISRDPLWPSELAYGYAGGNPVSNIDQAGLFSLDPSCKNLEDRPKVNNCLAALCAALSKPSAQQKILRCADDNGVSSAKMIDCLRANCKVKSKIRCGPCDNVRKMRINCCPKGKPAFTWEIASANAVTDCKFNKFDSKIELCPTTQANVLAKCPELFDYVIGNSVTTTVIHEILHVCGNCAAGKKVGEQEHQARYNRAAACVMKAVGCRE